MEFRKSGPEQRLATRLAGVLRHGIIQKLEGASHGLWFHPRDGTPLPHHAQNQGRSNGSWCGLAEWHRLLVNGVPEAQEAAIDCDIGCRSAVGERDGPPVAV